MEAMKRNFFLTGALCAAFFCGTAFLCGVARANDSAVTGVGGSWRPLKGEHRAVRMVRENISMNVALRYSPVIKGYYAGYDVTANFVFKNHGAAQWVEMGFPERGSGDIEPKKAQFQNFKTWVNGRRVAATRRIIEMNTEDFTDYNALWTKRVYFKSGETKKIRVSYSSDAGSTAGVGWYAPYDFTGANWRSDVAESWIAVTLSKECKFVFANFNDRKTYVASRKLSNGLTRFFKRWTNWPAQGGFQLWFDAPKLRG
jgi:hypothetical protein